MGRRLLPAIATAWMACTGAGSSTSSSSSSSSGSVPDVCDDNRTDGASPAESAKPFTLGLTTAGTACYVEGTQYFYWVAPGTYDTANEFTVNVRIVSPSPGDSITLHVDSGQGMIGHSRAGPSASAIGGSEATVRDLAPFRDAASDKTKLYVLAYATSADAGGAVDFEFTVTMEAP